MEKLFNKLFSKPSPTSGNSRVPRKIVCGKCVPTTCFAIVSIVLFLMGLALQALELDLTQFASVRNCKAECQDGTLVITDIRYDHSVIYDNLNIIPAEYNAVKIMYCADGFSELKTGELFFASEKGNFANELLWGINGLRADGKWHEIELNFPTSVAQEAWDSAGKIAKLRLDMTNSPGSLIKVRSVQFFKREALAPVPTWYWSIVGETTKLNTPYFQGMMVSCKEEVAKPELNKDYFVRRTFTLPESQDIQEAFLQFMGDDSAIAFLNGTQIASNNNWKVPTVATVTDKLVKGENMLGFIYRNELSFSGVLCELYVRFASGETIRINTDEHFMGCAVEQEGWNLVGASNEGWSPAVTQPASPTAPWTVILPYINYDTPANLLSITTDKSEYGPCELCHLTLKLEGRMPHDPPIFEMSLTNETNQYSFKGLTGKKQILEENEGVCWQYDFDVKLPQFAPTGNYSINIKTLEFMLKSKLPAPQIHYVQNPLPKERTTAEVRQIGPTAVIHINGKPFYSIGTNSYRLKELYTTTVSISGHTVFWKGIDQYYFGEIDEEAERILAEKPDAYLLVGMELYPPADWAKQNPDDMCQDADGNRIHYYRTMYSNSSAKARAEMQKTTRLLIEHCENSAYRDRILGYRLHGGTTIEWLGWGHYDKKRQYDYSPVARQSFKRFIAQYYPYLTDELPSAEQIRAFDGNVLLDSKKDALRIAHNDFISHEEAEILAAIAKTAKEAVQGRKLIGAYYGYTCFLPILSNVPETAHLCLKRLMDYKVLDFLMSPHNYSTRYIGETSADMKPITSMEANGIVPILENDTRSNGYLKKYNPKERYAGDYAQAVNSWQFLQLCKRDLGIAIVRRQPFMIIPYLWDHSFEAHEVAAPSKAAAMAGQWILDHDVKRRAEIAVVVSEESFKHIPHITQYVAYKRQSEKFNVFTGKPMKRVQGGMMFTGALVTRLCEDTSYLGAPADFILAEDLKDHPADYKMWIFANCFAVDDAFVKAVKRIQDSGATLLWLYAPGYIQNGIDEVENMTALTGFKFNRVEGKRIPTIFCHNSLHGEPRDTICPSFEVIPEQGVEILGTYEDNEAPALASRQAGKSRIIYCGINAPGNKLIKQFATEAGVHFFTDNNDAFDSNDAFFTLHAAKAGTKTIRLPKPCDILDIYNRKIVARKVETFSFDAPLFTSHLFYYGNEADELLRILE